MIEAYFDGCCEPVNPGGTAAYGVVIFEVYGSDDVRQIIFQTSKIFKPVKGHEKETSNNIAEYSGLEAILLFLLEERLNEEEIVVRGDSRLVICQNWITCGYRKRWKIESGLYVPIAYRCRELLKQFPKIRGEWIPRDKNSLADELSKAELRRAGVKFRIQPEG